MSSWYERLPDWSAAMRYANAFALAYESRWRVHRAGDEWCVCRAAK